VCKGVVVCKGACENSELNVVCPNFRQKEIWKKVLAKHQTNENKMNGYICDRVSYPSQKSIFFH
jgi:hypothetical protein